LARAALRAATQAADGRGEPTQLLPAILEHWRLDDALDLIPRVYRAGLAPADMAQLAPLVVRVAQDGDHVARGLIEGASAALADMVIAVARAVRSEEKEIPLALSGGLLLQAESLRTRLLAELRSRAGNFSPVALVHEPAIGAVRLAVELARP
jgi:N-acetylglucosamine kinase-like BadF-type ATPase